MRPFLDQFICFSVIRLSNMLKQSRVQGEKNAPSRGVASLTAFIEFMCYPPTTHQSTESYIM